jgi:hypothetical protein
MKKIKNISREFKDKEFREKKIMDDKKMIETLIRIKTKRMNT